MFPKYNVNNKAVCSELFDRWGIIAITGNQGDYIFVYVCRCK